MEESELGSIIHLSDLVSSSIGDQVNFLNIECFNNSEDHNVVPLEHQNNSPHSETNNFEEYRKSISVKPSVRKNLLKNASNKTGSVAANNGNQQIPFVQIHTIDVQPLCGNFGNIFRRTTNSYEIKSEPIKSENTDSSKEGPNASTLAQASNWNNDEIEPENGSALNSGEISKEVNAAADVNVVSNASVELNLDTFPNVHKCNQCAYISLNEVFIAKHAELHHNSAVNRNNRLRLLCPGCDNVIYSYKSLKLHLLEDHLMNAEDCEQLMRALEAKYGPCKDQASLSNPKCQRESPKNRIYLKNVNCLREPQRDPIEQQNNLLTENCFQLNAFINDCSEINNDEVDNAFLTMLQGGEDCENTNQIVDEPDRDLNNGGSPKIKHNLENSEVIGGAVDCQRSYNKDDDTNSLNLYNELELNGVNNNEEYNNDEKNNIVCTIENLNNIDINNCPKIYIRNIISKNSMVTSDSTANFNCVLKPRKNVQYLNSDHAVPLNQNYDEQDISFGTPLNSNTLDLSFGINNDEYCLMDIESQNSFAMDNLPSNMPTITGSTSIIFDSADSPKVNDTNSVTPASAKPKQKIFIKNVDILKEPHFQEQRGTLHLRTVDELNLMNENEVQNLIAPNLDNTMTQGYLQNKNYNELQDVVNKIPETKNIPDAPSKNQIILNWNENVECINNTNYIMADSVTMNSERSLTDLQTPLMSFISFRDVIDLTGNQNAPQQPIELEEALETALTLVPQFEAGDICKNEQAKLEQSKCTDNTDLISHSQQIFECNTLSNMKRNATLATATDNESAINVNVPSLSLPPLIPLGSASYGQTPSSVPCKTAPSSANITIVPAVTSTNDTVSVMSNACSTFTIISTNKTDAEKSAGISVAKQAATPSLSSNIMVESESSSSCTSVNVLGTEVAGHGEPAPRTIDNPKVPINIAKWTPLATELNDECSKAQRKKFAINKCTIPQCTLKFSKVEVLEYHLRCHKSTENSGESICPECKMSNFKNWTNLHTHLWRLHKIDMELYSCSKCSFKTPSYSRLVNTHLKIHSEERNFKCNECQKGFKNSKQLKNHRRIHRSRSMPQPAASVNAAEKSITRCDDTLSASPMYQCGSCNNIFISQRNLREHLCKKFKCSICGKVLSSKSSLKLHQQMHDLDKRYKCNSCAYSTGDHNAFRRHKMKHDSKTPYACPYCDYKSIQSVPFRKHIKSNHSDDASIIFKCNYCKFTTVSSTLHSMHEAKHLIKQQNGAKVSQNGDGSP